MLEVCDYHTEITPFLNAEVTAPPQHTIVAIQEPCDYHTEIIPCLEC